MYKICLFFLMSALLQIGSVQAGTLTSIPSSAVENPKAFWAAVMEEFYGRYDKRLKCWVGSGGSGKICMRPHLLASVPGAAGLTHYVAMSGYAPTSDGGRADCHACSGKLGLVMLRGESTHLTLVARNSLAEDAGSWGATPSEEAFRVVRLGQGNHGWLMESGYTGQGYTEGGVTVFAAIGDKIVDLGFIPTHSDNGGTCGDGIGPCYVHTYEILTDPDKTTAAFGDLLARKVESTNADAPAMVRVPFAQDELKYVAPDCLDAALGK
ncbi:hypothetical protein PZ897_02865 [Hoeflea sp. YIM 152468]|uniref:hypothetical protein n=1 Tax=Hoeflea sp. YIM 152468 TaxID=3031759 RepID=UPI0023DB8327|nr:hypothetical protein [Hoeflea sp. YIM 152468]MDF1607110.1 hypothetical protein [Hoeflea sp. YIM 152468]